MHLRGLSYEEKKLEGFFPRFQPFNNTRDPGNIFSETFSFWLDVAILANFLNVLASWLHSRFVILRPLTRGTFRLFLQFLC